MLAYVDNLNVALTVSLNTIGAADWSTATTMYIAGRRYDVTQ